MTQEQCEVRKQRAERDVFVITVAEEGWRVPSGLALPEVILACAAGVRGVKYGAPNELG